MILGLTGGLGCGKSTAAQLFAQHGFRRLDSDALVRDEVLTHADVVRAIRDRFGTGVLQPDGTINRAAVAAIVFSQATELRWLEDLVHPRLYARWRELLGAAPSDRWVVEVPLLFERSLENWFDFIACVTCAPAQQVSRLERRGLSRALAEQRISKQLPLARKIELSDYVLLNDGSTEFLQKQVERLVGALLAVRC